MPGVDAPGSDLLTVLVDDTSAFKGELSQEDSQCYQPDYKPFDVLVEVSEVEPTARFACVVGLASKVHYGIECVDDCCHECYFLHGCPCGSNSGSCFFNEGSSVNDCVESSHWFKAKDC